MFSPIYFCFWTFLYLPHLVFLWSVLQMQVNVPLDKKKKKTDEVRACPQACFAIRWLDSFLFPKFRAAASWLPPSDGVKLLQPYSRSEGSLTLLCCARMLCAGDVLAGWEEGVVSPWMISTISIVKTAEMPLRQTSWSHVGWIWEKASRKLLCESPSKLKT